VGQARPGDVEPQPDRRGVLADVVRHQETVAGPAVAWRRRAAVIQIVTAQIYYGLFLAGEQPSQAIAERAAATAAAAARAGALAAAQPGLCPISAPGEVPENERPAEVTTNVHRH
jgi:hypothetical protein